jgi:hypothetical protein
MAFPNVSDIVATTIESRTREIQDNVTKNNAFFAQLKEKKRVKEVSGGSTILQEISFQANPNAGWYSCYDTLPTAAADVITAAQFPFRQAACPVTFSGLEMLQNTGKEEFIDLTEARLAVAEASMANLLAQGAYSDGTGFGGKQIMGLDIAVPVSPTTGVYGSIDRSVWTFWRSQVRTAGSAITTATVQTEMNAMWALLVRGQDRPDLCIMDPVWWQTYVASLQLLQRFTGTETAKLGFPTVKFFDADVVLDGGIGGFATTKTAYWINSKYFYFRPHKQRNMVPLEPNKRVSTNQDAQVQILAWAGNITCAGPQFCGRSITP